MITHSLAFDHDLDLTNDYADPTNLDLGGHFEGGAHLYAGKDGRLRPVHDIGMPVLFVPYYVRRTCSPSEWLRMCRRAGSHGRVSISRWCCDTF